MRLKELQVLREVNNKSVVFMKLIRENGHSRGYNSCPGGYQDRLDGASFAHAFGSYQLALKRFSVSLCSRSEFSTFAVFCGRLLDRSKSHFMSFS
jgi:hypothetical protein